VRIAAAAAVVRRPPVAVVVKADVIKAVTAAGAATFVVEVAVVGVGRLSVAAIVGVLEGNITSIFPDKTIQRRFASLRADRRALPTTLVRYVIGSVL
jgi:hypothetical protein